MNTKDSLRGALKSSSLTPNTNPKEFINVPENGTDLMTQPSIRFVEIVDEIDPETKAEASKFVDFLMQTKINTPAFEDLLQRIERLGNKDFQDISRGTTKVFNKRIENNGNIESAEEVELAVKSLKVITKELDITKIDLNPTGINKILKKHQTKQYFGKYQNVQETMNQVIMSLLNGRDLIMQENAFLIIQRNDVYESLSSAEAHISLVKALEEEILDRIQNMKTNAKDSNIIKKFEAEVLFAVRQKHVDMLTRYTVAEQAYISIDLILDNNQQVLKNIESAKTNVITALQTSLLVAQSLSNQKLLLDGVDNIIMKANMAVKKNGKNITDSVNALNTRMENNSVVSTRVEQISHALEDLSKIADELEEYQKQTEIVTEGAKTSLINQMKTVVEATQTTIDER